MDFSNNLGLGPNDISQIERIQSFMIDGDPFENVEDQASLEDKAIKILEYYKL